MRARWVGLLAISLIFGCGRTESAGDDLDGGGSAGRSSGGSVAAGGRTETGGASGGKTGTGGALGGETSTGGAGTGGDGTSCSLVKTIAQSVFLRNQSDVERFRDVGRFEGHLYVTEDVTDLSPLECLSEITGEFGVFEAKVLRSLAGLENLRTVGGLLAIGHFCTVNQADCIGNPVLEDVTALGNLERAKKISVHPKCDEDEGGPYNCAFNAALEELAFDSLVETEEIFLAMNPMLESAQFDSLVSATSFTATYNEKLRSLSLDAATEIDEIQLNHCPLLDELALPRLEQSELIDINVTALEDLRGFGNAETIGRLELTNNAKLQALDGLEKVSSLEFLAIESSPSLESIAALSALESIATGGIYLFSNPKLASLKGLENLKHLGGLTLAYQSSLTGVAELSSLETCPQNLSIYGNELLESLAGLEKIETTLSLQINSNAILTSLAGLDGLERVSHLSIQANPLLPTCEAERLEGSLVIDGVASIAYNDDAGTCEP